MQIVIVAGQDASSIPREVATDAEGHILTAPAPSSLGPAAAAASSPVVLAGGSPVAFTVAVTDVAAPLKAVPFAVLAGSTSVEVDVSSTGAVSIGGAGVSSADLANAVGSREDGLHWDQLDEVYAVCPAGLTATLRVRAVVP